MIFTKISQNFIKISLKILVNLTDFSPQVMAKMRVTEHQQPHDIKKTIKVKQSSLWL